MYEANDFKVTQTKKPIFRLAFDLVAGEPQISNFIEGYEMVVELWLFMNRDRD